MQNDKYENRKKRSVKLINFGIIRNNRGKNNLLKCFKTSQTSIHQSNFGNKSERWCLLAFGFEAEIKDENLSGSGS